MTIQPAVLIDTVLPLDLSQLSLWDDGRHHSVWLTDHLVSFWPDSIWTPEFTDFATISPSPHRHLDSLAVAGTASALTKKVSIVTCAVDTVRRHPAMLAQAALTLSHLSRGRFILGLGSGETENTVPYGFDFNKPVSRYEEALRVIRLLWESDGPVNFEGQFYQLHHARLDTEAFENKDPNIWGAGSGPRMLDIIGRYCDGWMPGTITSPADYATKLKVVQNAAERGGRDPMALATPFLWVCLIAEDDAELAKIVESPLVKSLIMQIPARIMRDMGFEHPLGDDWRGIQDISPELLPRERILKMLKNFNAEVFLKITPHGTPQKVAQFMHDYVKAGVRIPQINDFSRIAGLKFAEKSVQKVRKAEDELARLCL
jgi:phthiodiolone/phenolphthiodiolone dimycocerosates ketoreductase